MDMLIKNGTIVTANEMFRGDIGIQDGKIALIGASLDVLFVGMLDRIALWDKAAYERSRLSSNDFAKRLAEKMMKKSVD